MLFLCAKSIFQIKAVDAQLVGHDHIAVIRHTACDPVVATDGLQPPDLVHILKGNAVHLISAVGLQQMPQPLHALAGGADVGQGQEHDILFADAAGHLGRFALCRLVHHQRVCAQHPGIGGDGLGGGHGHIGRIDAACRPDAFALHGVGHGGEPHGSFRQRHFHMGEHRAVHLWHLLRVNGREFFGGEMTRAGIVVAGDHGGAVVRSIFTD